MNCTAGFSPCRLYRYWLLRQWDEGLPVLCVIGVNPSTADETKDDPTIRKDIGFAKRLGYGSLLKLNVGAFRSTDPKVWRKAADKIGPENSADHLLAYARRFNAATVIAAWGRNGSFAPAECAAIGRVFESLWCWGRNSDGTPAHPLMLPYSSKLEKFIEGEAPAPNEEGEI